MTIDALSHQEEQAEIVAYSSSTLCWLEPILDEN